MPGGAALPAPAAVLLGDVVDHTQALRCQATLENCDVRCMAVSRTPDRALVWTLEKGGGLYIIDAQTKEVVSQVTRSSLTCLTTDCFGNCWAGAADGSVHVVTLDLKHVLAVDSHSGPVTCITAHQEFVFTAGGTTYYAIHKWHAAAQVVARKFGPIDVPFLGLVAGDQDVYSVGHEGCVRVWDASSGSNVAQWPAGLRPSDALHCVCRWEGTVWAGSAGGHVVVWACATGTLLRSLKPAHAGPVQSLASVGATVWSGAEDGVLRVWHAPSRRLLAERREHRGAVSAILAVGRYAFHEVWSSGSENAMKIWNVSALGPVDGPSTLEDEMRDSAIERLEALEQQLDEERDRATHLRLQVSQLQSALEHQQRLTHDAQQALSLQSPSRIFSSPPASPEKRLSGRSIDLCDYSHESTPRTSRSEPRGRVVSAGSPTEPLREELDLTGSCSTAVIDDLCDLLNCDTDDVLHIVEGLLTEVRDLQAEVAAVRAHASQQGAHGSEELREIHAANLELDLLNRRLIATGEQQAARIQDYQRTIAFLEGQVNQLKRTQESPRRGVAAELRFMEDTRDAFVEEVSRLYAPIVKLQECNETIYNDSFRAPNKRLTTQASREVLQHMTELLRKLLADYRGLVSTYVTYREKVNLGLDLHEFSTPHVPSPRPKAAKGRASDRSPAASHKPKPGGAKPRAKERRRGREPRHPGKESPPRRPLSGHSTRSATSPKPERSPAPRPGRGTAGSRAVPTRTPEPPSKSSPSTKPRPSASSHKSSSTWTTTSDAHPPAPERRSRSRERRIAPGLTAPATPSSLTVSSIEPSPLHPSRSPAVPPLPLALVQQQRTG